MEGHGKPEPDQRKRNKIKVFTNHGYVKTCDLGMETTWLGLEKYILAGFVTQMEIVLTFCQNYQTYSR